MTALQSKFDLICSKCSQSRRSELRSTQKPQLACKTQYTGRGDVLREFCVMFCVYLHIYPPISRKLPKRYNELAWELLAVCPPLYDRGITQSAFQNGRSKFRTWFPHRPTDAECQAEPLRLGIKPRVDNSRGGHFYHLAINAVKLKHHR